MKSRRWLICIALSVLVAVAVVGMRWTGLLQSPELALYDLFVRLGATRAELNNRIVLIGATEEDIERLGWPLSDAQLAGLLETVAVQNPQVVGLDLYRGQPIGDGGTLLRDTLSRHDNIIGVMKFAAPGEIVTGTGPHPALKGSGRIGFADYVLDPQGTIRRGLLFLDDGVNFEYSLALRMALRVLEPLGIVPRPDEENPEHIRLGETTIRPLHADFGSYVGADDGGYQFMLDYGGAQTEFPAYSISNVLDGKLPDNVLRGKIVFIGATATSLKDFFFTPFSNGLSARQSFGVTLHGYITSQLLRMAVDGQQPLTALREVDEAAWILAWALLGGMLGLRLRSTGRFVIVAVCGVSLLVLAGYGLFVLRWWIPVLPPAVAWLLAATVCLSYVSSQEKAEKAQLMHIFGRHVSQQVAENIWNKRAELLEDGRPRSERFMATVLFTDLKGFTTISETLDPADLMNWLNVYMESMARLVIEHGGIIDKFIGDAVMAVFGVPERRESEAEIAGDALAAVTCALAMERELERLNDGWAREGKPLVGMRVGIFTGPIVAGGLGSAERADYTVIGDTVNTAARLESFDKSVVDDERPERVCRILIGAPTAERLGDRYTIREVGSVQLKGKEEATNVFLVTRQ